MQRSFSVKGEGDHRWCVERYLKEGVCVLFELIILTFKYEKSQTELDQFALSPSEFRGQSFSFRSVSSRRGVSV